MAMTPKQDRNGVPGPSTTGGVSMPGPDSTREIASVQRQAQAAGNARKSHDYLRVPASDPHTEWDAGLAINEPAGEA